MRADRSAGADSGRQCVLVGLGTSQSLEIRGGGPRESVIGKNRPSAHHNPVLYGDRIADVNEGIDFYPVSDVDIVGDVGFLANNAFLSDPGAMPDVNRVPDTRAGADLHIIFDDSGGMNAYSRKAACGKTALAGALGR